MYALRKPLGTETLVSVTFDQWAKRDRGVAVREKSVQVSMLKQAAVEAKLLTGHLAWDAYLSQLQVLVDEAQGELNGLYERMGGPLTEEQLRLAYISINVFTERLRVLKHCMSLPHDLVKHADELGPLPDTH